MPHLSWALVLGGVLALGLALASSSTPFFNPARSRSFAQNFWGGQFSVDFESGISFSGWSGIDMFQLGPYSSLVSISGITSDRMLCQGVESVQCDGILGLSFKNQSTNLAHNFIYELATFSKVDVPPSSNKKKGNHSPFEGDPIPSAILTLVLTSGESEIQLGGIRSDSIIPSTRTVIPVPPSCTSCKGAGRFQYWQVYLEELYLGKELIYQDDIERKFEGSQSVLCSIDSGTSGILLPTKLYDSFVQSFELNSTRDQTLYFGIRGQKFNVTTSSYIITSGLSTKVLVLPAYDANSCVLGDPFLRSVVASFDVRNASQPFLTLAGRNPDYVPGAHVWTPTFFNYTKKRGEERERESEREEREREQSLIAMHPVKRVASYYHTNVTALPVSTDFVYYFINVTVGTPRQGYFLLVLDTATDIVGIHSRQAGLPDSIITMIIGLTLLFLICCCGVSMFVGYLATRGGLRKNVREGMMTPPPDDESLWYEELPSDPVIINDG